MHEKYKIYTLQCYNVVKVHKNLRCHLFQNMYMHDDGPWEPKYKAHTEDITYYMLVVFHGNICQH
jgi:hypothetical protein